MISDAITAIVRVQIAQQPRLSDLAIDGFLLRALLLEQWTPEQWAVAGFTPPHVREIKKAYGLLTTRGRRLITYHFQSRSAADWLALCDHHPSVTSALFAQRAAAGWPLHAALHTPRRRKHHETLTV